MPKEHPRREISTHDDHMETPNLMIEQALGRYVASSEKYVLGVIRDIYWNDVFLDLFDSELRIEGNGTLMIKKKGDLAREIYLMQYRCLYRTENPVVWDSHPYLFTRFSDAGSRSKSKRRSVRNR
ncbi:hypothetical protein PIB30_097065 [Stylosanthes scabra]|uniref:Uncharacterized protein n=1 Tax=Stylosanthes scabra TaxID=79078 RepID=A0ABU6SWH9_9FABA|nr:hypothetical protein [Stylosanthes scabra]